MPRRLLTDRFCATAKSATPQTDYFDEQTTGLALRVSRSGRKTWTFHYGPANARVRMTLGTYPATSLAAARTAADVARGNVEAGNDPRVRLATDGTLRSVCEQYLKRDGAKLRTVEWREAQLERLVYPTLGARPIGEIRRSDIAKLLDGIEDRNGAVMADRTLAVVRRVFNWYAARSDDFISPIVRGMARTKGKDRARERTLTDAELRAIWNATAGGAPFDRYIRFTLLTATRRSESARLHQREIDPSGDWIIPARRYKTKVDHLVPLSAPAIELMGGARPFAFSTNGGKTALCGFSKFKAALNTASGVTDWRIHDLRRTARTLMSRAGVPTDHAERCLGHTLGAMRGVYDKFAYRAEKLAAFEALAAQIKQLLEDKTVPA
jgi:integrase